MAATTRPLELLARFDRVERLVHWVNAALFATLICSGAILYVGPLSLLVGRRQIVEAVHVYCGLALPVPLLLVLGGRRGRALRADLRRFNRWTTDDRRWLASVLSGRDRRDAIRDGLLTGKFNAGQKLNAAFTAGVIAVMLGTGAIMRWYRPWPLAWRTGATFVHDWLAFLAVAAIAGHVSYALRDPDALRSMFTGAVPRSWAQRHAPGWVEELDEDRVAAGGSLPGPQGKQAHDRPGIHSVGE